MAFGAILVCAMFSCVTSNYVSPQGLMKGLVYPREIDAVAGEDIHFSIIAPVAHQTHCNYRVTGGKDVNIETPHAKNIERLDKEACGLRIKRITAQDQGFWRLISSNGSDIARGIVFINVRIESRPLARRTITSTDVDITPEDASYCYVLRPGEKRSSPPHHENCPFPEIENEVQKHGTWKVFYGLKGKTEELSFEVDVIPVVEQVLTSIERNGNAINMKCKLVHTKKVIKFCQFIRLDNDIGYHLEEGRGTAQYSYFGNGYSDGDCGISIADANENDNSPWKCVVGVDDDGELKTVGAIIDATATTTIPTDQDEKPTSYVYGVEHSQVNLLCNRNIAIDYCWFLDPSGQKISITEDKTSHSDKYSYFGTGFRFGECGLTILDASDEHSGVWSCHVGATAVAGPDTFEEISVRITATPLVASNILHDVELGQTLIIECKSIPQHVPLDYCRFVLPNGTGFSINEKTHPENLFLNNYYFTPNRHLKSGYCSMVLKQVDRSHHGQWMCAARLSGSDSESFDEIKVSVHDGVVSAASVTGMAFIAAILIGTLIFITYHSYRRNHVSRQRRRTTQRTVVSYLPDVDNVSIRSTHSGESQS